MLPKRWRSRKRAILLGLILSVVCIFLIIRYRDHQKAKEQRRDLIFSIIGSRNTTAFVKPDQDTVIIDGTLLKKKITKTRPSAPFALVMVLSQIGFEQERRVVRDTWYNWAAPLNTQVVFFLGLPPNKNGSLPSVIQGEIEQFKDIVVDDFVESYYLLTVKVLRMLKWFVKTYPDERYQPNFLVKTDHDVFNNLPNLIKYLKSVVDIKNFVGGLVFNAAPVIRNGYDKWYTPEELYAESEFPPYAAGPCYIISGSVVAAIYKTSLKTPLFHLEDIFITGFVAKMSLNIPLHGLKPSQVITSSVKIGEYEWDFKQAIAYHTVDHHGMKRYYYRAIHQQ